MSVNAVDWALRFAPVDARHNGAARVLMCLANVADDEGRNAHPTHRKLAAWCSSVPTASCWPRAVWTWRRCRCRHWFRLKPCWLRLLPHGRWA